MFALDIEEHRDGNSAIDDSDLLTVLPAEAVDQEVKAGRIVPLECETAVAQTRVALFYLEGSLLTPQTDLVIDCFHEA